MPAFLRRGCGFAHRQLPAQVLYYVIDKYEGESEVLKGIFLIVGAATAWGMGGVAGQYLHEYHQTDMVWLVMSRQILAGLLFLLYAGAVQKQNIFSVLRQMPQDIIAFSFCGILGAQLGFYYTIGLCNAATATVMQYMAPVYVMLWMSYKHRRWPEGRELLGIVGAVVGVFLIATHGSLDSLAISPLALLIGLTSAVSYAYYSIKPVEMLKHYSSALIIGWGQLISGLALILWRNPFTPSGNWDMHAYWAFGYLLLGATILSYALYLQGLKIVGPTKASLISCAEPLASIISVVFLLGTKLLVPDFIGMGCIIFTVLLLSLPKK